MNEIVALFHKHHIDTTPEEIHAMLDAAAMRQAGIVRDALTPELSAAETAALASVGVDPAATAVSDRAKVGTAARFAAMAVSSLRTAEVAAMLGVNASRIRQMVGEGRLYGMAAPRSGRGHRFPAFQFHARRPLPGLGAVLRALDPAVHPVAVEAFFVTPTADLEGTDGAQTSPRDWLAGGRDPLPVIRLARAA